MMAQTVLGFKLEKTRDEITAHAGLVLFGEFLAAVKLRRWINKRLGRPGSGAGYNPSEYVLPLVLMLQGGGRTLEDLRQVEMDDGLRELLRIRRFPSTDATGDWLRRMGSSDGLSGLEGVNREMLRQALVRDERVGYTLDIDATQIVAEKQGAKWTYKGEIGYMPMVGHLAENGLVVGEEFREGNEAPGSRNLEFVKHCVAQMPEGKKITGLRSDSAAYQADVFNYCEENGVTFAIGADLDEAVRGAMARIPAEAWRRYQEGWIAETVHSMNKTKKAFRLVVIRRPVQKDFFKEEDAREKYTVIASNREESAQETVAWYNRRGETSENRIKELKIGFGMERMPCGQFYANAMFFRIGVLSYNLFVLFKRHLLPAGWRRHQVQTVRWRLYQTAGKVVTHAGAWILKVRRWLYELFAGIRARCFEFARA